MDRFSILISLAKTISRKQSQLVAGLPASVPFFLYLASLTANEVLLSIFSKQIPNYFLILKYFFAFVQTLVVHDTLVVFLPVHKIKTVFVEPFKCQFQRLK